MDWTSIIIALITSGATILVLRLNIKAAAASAATAAQEAQRAAQTAAAQATEAKLAATITTGKVDAVGKQLDGRITMFMEEIKKRVEDAYAVGTAEGQKTAIEGQVATKIDEVQEHLTQQDVQSAERHEETNGKGPTAPDGAPFKRRNGEKEK